MNAEKMKKLTFKCFFHSGQGKVGYRNVAHMVFIESSNNFLEDQMEINGENDGTVRWFHSR